MARSSAPCLALYLHSVLFASIVFSALPPDACADEAFADAPRVSSEGTTCSPVRMAGPGEACAATDERGAPLVCRSFPGPRGYCLRCIGVEPERETRTTIEPCLLPPARLPTYSPARERVWLELAALAFGVALLAFGLARWLVSRASPQR